MGDRSRDFGACYYSFWNKKIFISGKNNEKLYILNYKIGLAHSIAFASTKSKLNNKAQTEHQKNSLTSLC